MFKNSFKLFFSNFDKVWKFLFYRLIVLAIIIGLIAPFYNVIKDIILANWTDSILDSIPATGLLYGSDLAGLIRAVVQFLEGSLIMLFTGHVWVGVYIMFMMFFIRPILNNMGKYATCEMLYGYMSSQSKVGFCSAYIRTIRKSFIYALLKTLLTLPLLLLTLGALYGLTMIEGKIYGYFLPFLVIVVLSLVLALSETLVCGWAPAGVVYGEGASKAYRTGIRAVFRRYGRVLSTALMLNLLVVFLIMGFGIVSILIFVPLYYGIISMFEMIMFYGSQGMKYYVDAETIVSPKKLEQRDKMKKTKYVL